MPLNWSLRYTSPNAPGASDRRLPHDGIVIVGLAVLAFLTAMLAVPLLGTHSSQNLLLGGSIFVLLGAFASTAARQRRSIGTVILVAMVSLAADSFGITNVAVPAIICAGSIAALGLWIEPARLPMLIPASVGSLVTIWAVSLVVHEEGNRPAIQFLAAALMTFSAAAAIVQSRSPGNARIPVVLCLSGAAAACAGSAMDERRIWTTAAILLVGTAVSIASFQDDALASPVDIPPRVGSEAAAIGLVALVSGSGILALVGSPSAIIDWTMAGAAAAGSIGLVFFFREWWRHNVNWLDRLAAAAGASRFDPLTGLHNRRGIDERANEEIARARRYAHPLSLMMIDLDDFKMVNDRFGHPAGDRVLREAARAIAGAIRSIDIAGRYGGEEFLVLLPETSLSGAEVVAERIRASIEDSGWVTASIGIAELDRHMSEAELISRADALLYDAKHSGKNRVMSVR